MTRTGMFLGLCSLAAACGDSTNLVDAISSESALTTAQCNFGGANACFDTFDACVAAQNADIVACNDALHACLPPPPPHFGGGGMQGGCVGMEGDGLPPPVPLPDGGLLPPPPPPPDGDGQRLPPPPLPDGGLPPPPPGGPHGPGPGDSAAFAACHTALEACLADTANDAMGCFAAEHTCVGDVLRADFAARCDAALANCAGSTDEVCTRITEQCTNGIEATPASCTPAVAE